MEGKTETSKLFLLGNEALAAGALKVGVRFAASYPGTPASEILPAFFSHARKWKVKVEGGWMINEKVAFEAALAASWCGTDAMVSMKQVGLNVAMDPLMSSAYTGTEAGFLVVCVDDPGPHSSQTEQDSRFAAMFAKIPVFDPSSPKDAYGIAKRALHLSRSFRIPVMVRLVLRVAHSRQSVEIEEPETSVEINAEFVKRPGVWTATPKFRYQLHRELNGKIQEIAKLYAKHISKELARIKGTKVILASGALYSYLADLGFEDVVKIDMPYPLDQEVLFEICEGFSEIWVVEETYPVIELQLPERRRVKGKLSGHLPKEGELKLEDIVKALDPTKGYSVSIAFKEKKPRLCPGCGHRPVFYAMRKNFPRAIFPGDIGCYTLGTNIGAVDTFVCMGASVSMGLSFAKVHEACGKERPVICTIGDSTFFHSGIPPLIEAVDKGAKMVVVILDNRTTAMTGGQPIPTLDIEQVVKGCGVEKIEKVHAYQFEEVEKKLKECWNYSKENRKPSVLLCRCPCVIYGQRPTGKVPRVDQEKCTNCSICYRIFECPAIEEVNGKAKIDEILCTGCEVCVRICPSKAIYV